MIARENLHSILSSIEDEFKANRIHFNRLESALLDNALRDELLHDKTLQQRFSSLYTNAIEAITEQLFNLSRYRFAAIEKNSISTFYESIFNQTENSKLFSTNGKNIIIYVQLDILEGISTSQRIIALQRWITIAIQLIRLNDYNTAASIYLAITTTTMREITQHFEKNITDCFNYLHYIFSPLNNFETLRDLMMGQCIPYLKTYGYNVKTNILKSIRHMHEKNIAFIHPDLYQDGKFNFSDSTIFITTAEIDSWFRTFCNSLSTNIWEGDYQKILSNIRSTITTLPHLQDNENLEEANRFFEKLYKNASLKLSGEHTVYEKLLQKLRQYIETTGTDTISIQRHEEIKILLNTLNSTSCLQEKIDYINEYLILNNLPSDTKVKINPNVVPLLKKMRSTLDLRNEAEKKAAILIKHQFKNEPPTVCPLNRFSIVYKEKPQRLIPSLPLLNLQFTESGSGGNTTPTGALHQPGRSSSVSFSFYSPKNSPLSPFNPSTPLDSPTSQQNSPKSPITPDLDFDKLSPSPSTSSSPKQTSGSRSTSSSSLRLLFHRKPYYSSKSADELLSSPPPSSPSPIENFSKPEIKLSRSSQDE